MKKEEIEKLLEEYSLIEPYVDDMHDISARCLFMFERLFKRVPNQLSSRSHFTIDTFEKALNSENPTQTYEDALDKKQDKICGELTLYNAHKHNEDSSILIIGRCLLFIAENVIAYSYQKEDNLTIMCTEYTIPNIIKDYIVFKNEKNDYTIKYVTWSRYGFNTTPLHLNLYNLDLTLNYNDDLPHEAICQFINSNTSGLCLLHGKPGTGKTTYIKHLVQHTDKTIFYMDGSMLNSITDSDFIEFLTQNKDSIFLIEDCEELLKERLESNSSRLNSLLNLTDGILGDSFKIKFICTFNASISKVDSALLRKGRTHVFYEFDYLSVEKSNNVLKIQGIKEEVTEPKSLADLYNFGVENMKSNVKKRKNIGF